MGLTSALSPSVKNVREGCYVPMCCTNGMNPLKNDELSDLTADQE